MAIARAVVAVVLAVAIWVFLYAVGEDTTAGQFVFLAAEPVVVLALLLYEVSRRWRWRRHADGGEEPEQVARKIARKYAVDLSRNNWLGAAIVFIGPPVAALASLIYASCPAGAAADTLAAAPLLGIGQSGSVAAFPSWPRWAQAALLVIGGVLVPGVLSLALGGGSPGAFLAGVIPGAIAGTVAFLAYRFRRP